MGQRHKHADAIIAWAEGKDVQVWDKNNERWCDMVLAGRRVRTLSGSDPVLGYHRCA